jgi:hypothetical protein
MVKHGKTKMKSDDEEDDKASAPPLDYMPGDDDAVKPAHTLGPEGASSSGAGNGDGEPEDPTAQHQHEEDVEDCRCLCIDVPRAAGPHSCFGFACTDCGVCINAHNCRGLSTVFTFPLTALLCGLTFGTCSTWYSRSLCGTYTLTTHTNDQGMDTEVEWCRGSWRQCAAIVFPMFLLLLLVLLCVDLVYLLVAMTVLCLFIAVVFFLGMPCMLCCPQANSGATTEATNNEV